MKIRRILASTALAGVLGLGAMTGASALDLGNIGAADKVAPGLINNAKCSDVRGALDALNATNGGRIYNKETTRNELVQNLRQATGNTRSEEHTSELQSRGHLVCRLLLEKRK